MPGHDEFYINGTLFIHKTTTPAGRQAASLSAFGGRRGCSLTLSRQRLDKGFLIKIFA